MLKLPEGYEVKNLKGTDHWWVDGACGFCVASGDSRDNAIKNAMEAIDTYKNWDGPGCPAWYV